MKRHRNSNGWEEITTVCIDIKEIWRNFSTNESWCKINEKHPRLGRTRSICKCCGSKWDKNNSDIALAFTNKGNKIICQDCTDFFEERGILVRIK